MPVVLRPPSHVQPPPSPLIAKGETYTTDGAYTVRIAGRSKRSKQAVVARPHPG